MFHQTLGVKNVVMVFTNVDTIEGAPKKTGWYLSEAAHPYTEFLKVENINIVFASRNGGPVPVDEASIEKCDDDTSQHFWNNPLIQEKLKNTVPIKDIHSSSIYAVFIVGGHGPMIDLYDCHELNILVENVYLKGGIIGAICHGPVGLLCARYHGAPLLQGREVTAWSNEEEKKVGWDKCLPFLLEDKLREIGAEVKVADPYQPNVVISDRLITGQNFASAELLGKKMSKMLRDYYPSYVDSHTLQVGAYAPGIEHKPGVHRAFREPHAELAHGEQTHGEQTHDTLPAQPRKVSQQPRKGVDAVGATQQAQEPGITEEPSR